MTTRRLLTLLFILVCPATILAQPFLLTERSWTSTRLGFYAGMNQSFYRGAVPLFPQSSPNRHGDGGGTNFGAGIVVEKAYSRMFSLSLRAGYEFMSARLAKDFTEEYRVADGQGTLYPVTREYSMDYAIHGFGMSGDAKLYPVGGPGLFLLAGISLNVMTTHTQSFEATIETPLWAKGAKQTIASDDIPDFRNLLLGVHVGMGFDIFMGKSFLSPQMLYEFPLTTAVTEDSSEDWRIENLKLSLAFTFPI